MNAQGSGNPSAGREVAPGVYRFGTKRINWYVVDGDEGVTVVDAGLPRHWSQLGDGLAALGRTLADVEALVLTHAHADHVGFAERLRIEAGVPVYVHEAETDRVQAGNVRPPRGLVGNLWRPAVARYFLEVLRARPDEIRPVGTVETVGDGDVLDVPGRPQVLHLPGHSPGACALWVADRDAVLCGDALATIDFATGRGGEPQLLPAWLNEDHEAAIASLPVLESAASLGRGVLLPGHGDRWEGNLAAAGRLARIGAY